MNKNDCFESDRLSFRGINEQDAKYLVKWRSCSELIKYFRHPKPITRESHLNWYNNSYIVDNSRYDFIIFEKASRIPIGYVGICNIDSSTKSFEIYYMIAEHEFQRKGFASEAIIAMIGQMQKQGFLHAIAVIHRDNAASIRTVEKLGFVCNNLSEVFLEYQKDC